MFAISTICRGAGIDFDMIEWTWFGDGYDYCSQGDDVLVIRLSIEGLTSIN